MNNNSSEHIQILNSLKKIENKIDSINKRLDKLEDHIDFVNNTYNDLKQPIRLAKRFFR